MEKYQLAKVHDYGGNLDKRWFVEYKFLHPESKLYVKFRVWISSRILTKQARYIKGIEVKNSINQRLKAGFNPFVNKQKQLIAAVLEIVEMKKHTCSPKSHASYRSMAGKFIEWVKANKMQNFFADEFTRQHAYAFLDDLLVKNKVGACTRNCYLICMKTIFNDLVKRQHLEINPWHPITRLKVSEPDLVLLSDFEKDKIRENLPEMHPRLYVVSLLVYYCFLRPAEIVRLQVKDIDLANAYITVQGGKSKNKKYYKVAMPDHLVNEFKKIGTQLFQSDFYVFTNRFQLTPGPKPMASTRIAEIWNQIVKTKLGINKNLYSLKHNGNGVAVESGIDIRQIQLQNRHWSLEQTQIYLQRFNKTPNKGFRDKMPEF